MNEKLFEAILESAPTEHGAERAKEVRAMLRQKGLSRGDEVIVNDRYIGKLVGVVRELSWTKEGDYYEYELRLKDYCIVGGGYSYDRSCRIPVGGVDTVEPYIEEDFMKEYYGETF